MDDCERHFTFGFAVMLGIVAGLIGALYQGLRLYNGPKEDYVLGAATLALYALCSTAMFTSLQRWEGDLKYLLHRDGVCGVSAVITYFSHRITELPWNIAQAACFSLVLRYVRPRGILASTFTILTLCPPVWCVGG